MVGGRQSQMCRRASPDRACDFDVRAHRGHHTAQRLGYTDAFEREAKPAVAHAVVGFPLVKEQ